MKIEEEKKKKTQLAQRDHAQKCLDEEEKRNIKMEEVGQMEKLEMGMF